MLNDVPIAVHTKPYRYFFVVQESGAIVQQLSWYVYVCCSALCNQGLIGANMITKGNNCKY